MLNLRSTASAMILSTALIMGACSKKDKAAPIDVPKVGSLSLGSMDGKAFDKMLSVPSRQVSDADAQKALKALGVSEDNGLTWGSVSNKGGVYTYKDVKLTPTDSDGSLTFGQLIVSGPHMDGEAANLDRVDIMDGSFSAPNEATVSIGRMTLSKPLGQIGSIAELAGDGDFDGTNLLFAAGLVEDLKVESKEANMTLETMGWGQNPKDKSGAMLLDGLTMTGQDGAGNPPVDMNIGHISITGVPESHLTGMKEMMAAAEAGDDETVGRLYFKLFNGLQKSFDEISFKDLNVSMDTMSFSMDKLQASAKEKGDDLIIKQVMEPMKFGFSGEPQESELQEVYAMMKSIDLTNIEMSARSTSIVNEKADTMKVTDSVLNVKDLMSWSYDFEGTGLGAISKAFSDNPSDMSEQHMANLMSNMTLKSMNMSITDIALMDKIFAVAAEQQGTSPALLKVQAKSGLMMLGMMAQTEEQGAFLTDLSSALGQFLDNGGTLNIGINPKTPISAQTMQGVDPSQINPADLGLTVSHN